MDFLLNVGIAVLGILIYTIFAAKKFVGKKAFDWEIFARANVLQWLWSFVAAFIISAVMTMIPEAGPALKAVTGLDLAATPAGYLSLGIGLSAVIRQSTK